MLSFSDWYHDPMRKLLASFVSVTNPTGAEPVPVSALINDSQNVTVPVQPGKTYMIRMVRESHVQTLDDKLTVGGKHGCVCGHIRLVPEMLHEGG